MEVAPPAVARAPAAVENRLIIGGADISWMTPPTKKECPDETTSPGRLEASGADEYSCAGRSYKTLFQSKDFVALVPGERHKALREWMQSDAKSRADASGDSSAVWRHEMASIEIAYAKRYNESLPCDCFWLTLALPVSLLWITYFAATWIWTGNTYSGGNVFSSANVAPADAPSPDRRSNGAFFSRRIIRSRTLRALIVLSVAYAIVICTIWWTQSPVFGIYDFLLACYWF